MLVFVQMLERNWKTIRDEALAVMDQNTGLFVPEDENLRERGEWGQYTLWQQGTARTHTRTNTHKHTHTHFVSDVSDGRVCVFFREEGREGVSGGPQDLLPARELPRGHWLQERTGGALTQHTHTHTCTIDCEKRIL